MTAVGMSPGAIPSAACAAALLLGLGCHLPRPTPPAPFTGRADVVPVEEVLGYAATLSFDTLTGLSDQQYLRLPAESTAYEPLAVIMPEVGAFRLSMSEAEQGRVVAKIISTGSYEHLGIERGSNYLWIGGAPDSVIGIMISESLRTTKVFPMFGHPTMGRGGHATTGGVHPADAYSQGSARWWEWVDTIWVETGGRTPKIVLRSEVWLTCAQYGCCCSNKPCQRPPR
jgi:hypothetical protein